MAQQRIIGAKTQRKADFTDAARRRRPDRRRSIQLRQPLIIGKTGNTKITLRHTFHAKQPLFAHGA